jgi:hypothetical protein
MGLVVAFLAIRSARRMLASPHGICDISRSSFTVVLEIEIESKHGDDGRSKGEVNVTHRFRDLAKNASRHTACRPHSGINEVDLLRKQSLDEIIFVHVCSKDVFRKPRQQ